MLSEWKKNVEGQWSSVREEWAEERTRLSKAREEWETKVKEVDVGIATLTTLQSKAQSSASSSGSGLHVNGDVHHGLATPPSPRSLSADSRRSSRGPRRKRSGSSRGRTGNRSRSQSPAGTSGTSASSYEDGMTDSTSVTSVSQSGTGDDDPLRATSPDYNNKTRELEDGKHHEADFANELEGETLGSLLQTESFSSVRLLTEGSLCSDSSTSTATGDSRLTVTRLPGDPLDDGDGDSLHIVGDFTATEMERKRAAPIQYIRSHPIPTTAFGVLVIGVAAAVLWKVKE
ncbi:hypothetical protein ONZ45_g17605 [Pleurotus djamor]|nr:hypothetical protein ONZ45_g17605 [Pleurotus djamor]